jgi:hypothetical protein
MDFGTTPAGNMMVFNTLVRKEKLKGVKNRLIQQQPTI